ncbi:hypothetical protein CJP72_21095 [Citrobacter sp. NCU1]|nr:hypothetical protein [Citrobacter sp. NCU1]
MSTRIPKTANSNAHRTSVVLWPETTPKADIMTLHLSTEAGRLLTRTEAINLLIERAAASINQSEAK